MLRRHGLLKDAVDANEDSETFTWRWNRLCTREAAKRRDVERRKAEARHLESSRRRERLGDPITVKRSGR